MSFVTSHRVLMLESKFLEFWKEEFYGNNPPHMLFFIFGQGAEL